MPSHVTHLLFAEEVIDRVATPDLKERDNRSYLALGAQGPDIFYHNQRRKPSALAYGSLMHRRGYGKSVGAMAEWSRGQGLDEGSWAAAWCAGFATHAILDRYAHPYINSRSGWVEQGKPETDRYRSMHPFLERLIDVALLREKRGIHPNELDFFRIVDCGESPPRPLIDLLTAGLSSAYQKASNDRKLRERLEAAYLDTRSYYHVTNYVDQTYLENGIKRAKQSQMSLKWLSIVHPPEVPDDIDPLNLRHVEWPHPCDEQEGSNKSVLELYDEALEEAADAVGQMINAWRLAINDSASGDPSAASFDARSLAATVEEAVANWNLSDGRKTERPCKKRYSRPMPLAELQDRIRASIEAGNGGRL
jgi:hypothetical protein